jgi:hypothetical protein
MSVLTDDEFLNAPPPAVVVDEVKPPVGETELETPTQETQEEVVETPTEEETVEGDTVVEVPATDGSEVPPSEEKPETDKEASVESDGDLKPPVKEEPKEKKLVDDKPATDEKPVVINYEEQYKAALAPLKANGKTVEIQSLDELRQLASMGANFTRKMQDIAPHRKILAMLENNGMLDEAKLSFYIDLEKKNPEALKKLIKDSGVDPLDIDVSVEPAYEAGNHKVTDQEIAFRAVLEDLQSTPAGKETISLINSSWDDASKQELWKTPEAMATIQQQRENGVYDIITTEVNRQAVLGKIPAGTPFITSYIAIGNELHTRGAFNNLNATNNQVVHNAPKQTNSPVITPVATRVAAPKSSLTNGAAANAAASTRLTPKRIVPVAKLENLSDDDFLKNWQNRL